MEVKLSQDPRDSADNDGATGKSELESHIDLKRVTRWVSGRVPSRREESHDEPIS
jgi:hypothetical protein